MNQKKLYLAALAMSMFVAPMVVQHVDASEIKRFTDVSESHWAYDIIHKMRDQKIIAGYENDTFRPNEVISRKHVAALVSRAKDLPAVSPFIAFKDISEKNVNYNDIKKLQRAGIFEADSKGNFNPNKPITRAEMAKVLTIAFDLEVKATNDFKDVPSSHVANKYVRALYSNGVTTGDNGFFKPNEPLTRAHYAVFMHRALNVEEQITPQPIPKPTVPTEVQTVENFNATKYLASIKNDPTFQLKNDYTINNDAVLNKKYLELLVKLDDIVKNHPEFVVTSVAGTVSINKKSYKSPLYDRGAWVGDNIVIGFSQKLNNNMLLKFDFMDDETVELAKDIFNALYPSVNYFNTNIDTKVAEARQGLATYKPNVPLWENFTGNVEGISINTNNIAMVQIGATRMFDGFAISVDAK